MNKFYDHKYQFSPFVPKTEENCLIIMSDYDTLGAAEKLNNPCCLNFASHKRPGGGYKSVMNNPMPIKTQEEDLFRRSNLPELMDTEEIRKHYPLKGLCGFYTDGIIVNKGKKLEPIDSFAISMVTVPALVNPSAEQFPLIRGKIERILAIAAENNHVNLILGAWGCGVFNNDPNMIAALFKEYLTSSFKNVFHNVVFAIPNKGSANYKTFKEIING